MKNWRALCLGLLLCLMLPLSAAFAADPAIHSVRIEVNLLENGDAEIREQWDVTVASGTEWYLSLDNMRDMTVTGLSVQDESGVPYTYLDTWDVERTIEEKANTCGIVREGNDYELCWGVGSLGRHQFTASYTITGLVKRYTDAAGFLHTFLSKGLSSATEQASVVISYPGHTLNDANAGIWAFGFDGSIHFADGRIVAESDGRISTNERIIIMVEFDTALFPDAPSGQGTFESIKNIAFEGSDYGESDGPGPVFWGVLIGASVLAVLLGAFALLRASLPDVYYRKQYGMSRSDLKKTAADNAQIPFGGDLPKTVAMLALFHETPPQVSVFNHYLLKWVREKAVTTVTEQYNDKTGANIQFTHLSYGSDALEEQLYSMMVSASNQGELTQKGIEKWAYKKHTQISAWYKEYLKQAAASLETEDVLVHPHVRRLVVSATIDALNEKGWAYASEVYGFKNYLLHGSQGQSGEVSSEYWDDYLAYADIFQIYDQVEGWYETNHMGPYGYGYYYYINRSFRSSYQSGSSRVDGGGGSSSSGGGGGASGGGGGGSR